MRSLSITLILLGIYSNTLISQSDIQRIEFKIDSTMNLALMTSQNGRYKDAIMLVEQALKIAEKHNYHENIVQARNALNWLANATYSESLFNYFANYQYAIENLDICNEHRFTSILNLQGYLDRNGKVSEFLILQEEFFQGVHQCDNISNDQKFFYCLNFGNSLIRNSEYKKSISYFEQALIFLNKSEYSDGEAKVNLYLRYARALMKIHDYQSSIDYLNLALSLIDDKYKDSHILKILALVDLSENFLETNQLDSAFYCAELLYNTQIEFSNFTADRPLRTLAKINSINGFTAKAEKQFLLAEEHATIRFQDDLNNVNLINCYLDVSEFYLEVDSNKNAEKFLLKSMKNYLKINKITNFETWEVDYKLEVNILVRLLNILRRVNNVKQKNENFDSIYYLKVHEIFYKYVIENNNLESFVFNYSKMESLLNDLLYYYFKFNIRKAYLLTSELKGRILQMEVLKARLIDNDVNFKLKLKREKFYSSKIFEFNTLAKIDTTNVKYSDSIFFYKNKLEKFYVDKGDYFNDLNEHNQKRLNLINNKIEINYFTGPTKTFVFASQGDSVQAKEIAWGPTEEKELELLLDLISNQKEINNLPLEKYKQFVEISRSLYKKLIPTEFIPEGTNEIVIVPDGRLNFIPFEILLSNDVDVSNAEYPNYFDLPYMLKDMSVQYLYSARLAMMDRKVEPTNKGVLAFAPEYKGFISQDRAFGKLFYNKKEVENIQKFFPGTFYIGANATKQEFLDHASEYRIIHLASHAMSNNENPDLSKLIFTDIDQDSTQNPLFPYEIISTPLNAEMVVLSACQSGIGKLHKGEGVFSLARNFIAAGAKSVVNSLWKVDDVSTSRLMSLFYENLHNGQKKSEALRNAKLALLADSDALTSHPYFWSSFVVIGDDAPIEKDSNRMWWIIGGVTCLALIGFGVKGINSKRQKEYKTAA